MKGIFSHITNGVKDPLSIQMPNNPFIRFNHAVIIRARIFNREKWNALEIRDAIEDKIAIN